MITGPICISFDLPETKDQSKSKSLFHLHSLNPPHVSGKIIAMYPDQAKCQIEVIGQENQAMEDV